ncbi:MAG: translation initiation factor IF-2 associated domain-containing protein, partial [Gallionellaceae bacterium]|nr:translation initiation factor IF-2 associated domain-containing protein [Gallionellaceae bacterium]
MGKMNVAQFAGELGLPVELLLEQLQSAGVVKKKDTDSISEQDKAQLLEHLRSAHGSGKNKITLVRRETTAIKKADSSGKSRTIQVEVRKKRTFVRRDDGVDVPAEAPE